MIVDGTNIDDLGDYRPGVLALRENGIRSPLAEAGFSKKIVREALIDKIKINDITEKTINNFLYTEGLPDPDLIIRTGGDCRLSNFLLWQSAYSELLFIKKAWPDFTKDDFLHAVKEFNNRERRFGGC